MIHPIADKTTKGERRYGAWLRHFPTDHQKRGSAVRQLHTKGRKHLLQGRKRDDSAFFVGSNYNIKGSESASVGPLAP
jgi:hypothetical protein